MNEVVEKSTALAKVNAAVVNIKAIEAQIADLAQLYGGTFDVSTAEGMKIAKNARNAVREPRLEIERIRIEAKRELLAVGKGMDKVAESLTAQILAIETPIATAITTEEKRIADERQALIDAEVKRVETLRNRIDAIRRLPVIAVNKTAAEVAQIIEGLTAEQITEAVFAEFFEPATNARVASVASLQETHAARVKHEAEAEQMRLQRIENERLQAEAAERKRLEDAERAAATAAEAKRVAEQQAQIDADRKKLEDEAKAVAEQKAANEREAARIEAERQAAIEREKQAERDRIAAADAEARLKQQAEADRLAQEQRDTAAAEAARKAKRRRRPTEEEIFGVLAAHYKVDAGVVRGWVAAIDWKATEAA